MSGLLTGGLAALLLVSGLAWADIGDSAASAPRVRLECLPDGDGADWHGWLSARLALRGLEEGPPPGWRLCFAEEQRQQWVDQPVDWRYDGYWRQPPYRLEQWIELSLTVKGEDGTVLWSGRERLGDGDNRRARLEQAARRLVDRMPLP
ncbi:hypothetical protein [Chromobacterium violaceum]|uniref:DUF4136 domain-containing protein n=1 Tax=Chromobacterium violaceum TaxID=536 RepID=A0AAX2M5W0_CHRVL|nr:hypothetical protein [Chromobacterium violaceum]ATP29615.1 hypothetical protein CRN81_15155 [Chromobacterium violaceum]ATP33521.1 hypothetical protein CR207_15165 [Chromobacterium violaceum]OLZ83778.1 hypothetical protein BS642_04935 [Chromobacterium violaceum]OQS46143.1 hypothetical protein B0T48_17110 [Chromobacterium violaceum]OQS52198.1 hypothetical protein B0T49_06510 [Chromobacterium violaceum]